MADFLKAYKRTGIFEGGYQADHNDNGNWTGGLIGSGTLIGTNYGISAPVLSKYLGRTATVQDMKNLSHDTVYKIYQKNYWDKVRGDEIEDQEIANQLYDMAVNAGVGTAINLCQKSLGLEPVGVMTKTTLDHLNNKV